MSFVIVGTNHRYSPVRLREKIFFSKKRLQDALDFLKETGALKAGVILSTCNRVEIYGCADTTEIGAYEIKSFVSRYYEIDGKDIYPYLYIYRDMDATRHLFRVASGLDSLILGGMQILSQVKAAFCESEKNGFVDYLLNEAFDSAVSVANRIHRVELFKRFYHGLLDRGIYFSPFGSEADFLSTTHSDEDIEKTIGAVDETVKYLRRKS